METIRCYDAQGGYTDVAADQVAFQAAAYGIFIENEQVLLVQHPQTRLWQPPGAPLVNNETPHDLLCHVFRQILGVTPLVGPLLFVEDRYELDKRRQAWQVAALYYGLKRPSSTAAVPAEIASSGLSAWVPVGQLQRKQMQFGYEAVRAGLLDLDL